MQARAALTDEEWMTATNAPPPSRLHCLLHLDNEHPTVQAQEKTDTRQLFHTQVCVCVRVRAYCV
jgi:hypothetical protein